MFNKLKSLFGITNFKANAVLKDGTELIIEGDIAVGVQVFVNTVDGNKPLPAGTYELEDGTMITVDENGIITDIVEPPVSEEEPVTEEVPVEETEQPKLAIEDEVAALTERVTKLEELVASITNQNKELQEDKEELSKQLKGFEEKLSKMDGASPIKKHKTVEDDDVFKLSPLTTSRMKALGLKK